MKTVAIMQPYLFPYIGYYQLVYSAHQFIFLDDVNFINKGWIHRNRMLASENWRYFSIPLRQASQNKKIMDIFVHEDDKWRGKLLKTVEQTYRKAPYFAAAFDIFSRVINPSSITISDMAQASIIEVLHYLGMETRCKKSSDFGLTGLIGQERILKLCQLQEASSYHNLIGGTELYDREVFSRAQIELHFLKSHSIRYPQFTAEPQEHLSILDVLMFNSPERIQEYLTQYDLIS
jgi:hypothetical protein